MTLLLQPITDRVRDLAAQTFLSDGFHAFVVLANYGGRIQPATAAFTCPEEKDAFAAGLLRDIASGWLREYVLICEAWTAADGHEGEALARLRDRGTLETFPHRAEILTILYTGPETERFWMAAIRRDPLRLEPWTAPSAMPGGFPLSRFAGLFEAVRQGRA